MVGRRRSPILRKPGAMRWICGESMHAVTSGSLYALAMMRASFRVLFVFVVLSLERRIFGTEFRRRVAGLGLREVPIAFRSPWQNAYAERFIGSLRRECLDHMSVLNERHFRRILSDYIRYNNCSRTHLALGKDAPRPGAVHERELGEVVAFPEVRGPHHRYERRAA